MLVLKIVGSLKSLSFKINEVLKDQFFKLLVVNVNICIEAKFMEHGSNLKLFNDASFSLESLNQRVFVDLASFKDVHIVEELFYIWLFQMFLCESRNQKLRIRDFLVFIEA